MPRLDAERVALWRNFQVAGEVVSRMIEAEMADEFHLSLPQFDVLAVLAAHNEQLRVKELCELLSAVCRVASIHSSTGGTSPVNRHRRRTTIARSWCA
jgi:hypothetical protein